MDSWARAAATEALTPRAAARASNVRRSMRPARASANSARVASSFDTRASFFVGHVRRTARPHRGTGGPPATDVADAARYLPAEWWDCMNRQSEVSTGRQTLIDKRCGICDTKSGIQ